MKIVGVITEYNPFHNGHLYHIEKAKELSGADAVVAVMSGNFVQRGAPAIMPKHLRTEVALKAGVSVVLELPVCYAAGSAEFFAEGAVSLLHSLGCIDSICFGSESGDIDILKHIADVLIDEPLEYKELLQSELKTGISFPRARQNALVGYLKDNSLNSILEQPNNILGIEYIKALAKRKSNINIFTIKRKESHYHSETLSENYSSASAIRKLLWHASQSVHMEADNTYDEPALSDVLLHLEGQVPEACIRLLEDTYRMRYPIYGNDFSLLLKYKLLTETSESLAEYMDISEGLANRIISCRNDFITFEQFCDLLKSREVTYARISRALFHILLNIKTSDMHAYSEVGHCQYGHILGFRKDSTLVLREFKKHSSVPLITKLTQTDALSDVGINMLKHDIFASDLYESVITNKFKMPFINEFTQSLVFV